MASVMYLLQERELKLKTFSAIFHRLPSLTTVNELKLTEVDVTQVTIAKARKVTTGTMMLARNPVMMISATKP